MVLNITLISLPYKILRINLQVNLRTLKTNLQAPFIGFLDERRVHKTENDGSIELLFGCRNHDSFIYKDELDMFKYDATLVRDFS